MKVTVFMASKTAIGPIMQCGGMVLEKADQLLVAEEIGKTVKSELGTYIIEVGTIDRDKLLYGHYEILKGKYAVLALLGRAVKENVYVDKALRSGNTYEDKNIGTKRRRK